MWILCLNPMTGRSEEMQPVARAETREELESFIEREREPWIDTGTKSQLHDTDLAATLQGPHVEQIPGYQWNKTFRRGSVLEWFNGPGFSDEQAFLDVGTREQYAQRAAERAYEDWDNRIASIPAV